MKQNRLICQKPQVLLFVLDPGLNLILWALCGMIAMGGALCFAELGTLIGESGGPWAYIRAGFGDAPAFVVAWTSILIPAASSAVISLSCAEYLLLVFFGDCNVPVCQHFIHQNRKNFWVPKKSS